MIIAAHNYGYGYMTYDAADGVGRRYNRTEVIVDKNSESFYYMVSSIVVNFRKCGDISRFCAFSFGDRARGVRTNH